MNTPPKNPFAEDFSRYILFKTILTVVSQIILVTAFYKNYIYLSNPSNDTGYFKVNGILAYANIVFIISCISIALFTTLLLLKNQHKALSFVLAAANAVTIFYIGLFIFDLYTESTIDKFNQRMKIDVEIFVAMALVACIESSYYTIVYHSRSENRRANQSLNGST